MEFTDGTMLIIHQEGTANTVISAIPAAIATNTTLLLGLWASEDQAAFNNELTALKNAISQYGSAFADLVVGISVGSEDLYRISPTGIAANSGYGQSPDVLVDYIGQTRSAISGTVLSGKPVGHVDTWNTYTNSSNAAVIAAADFLGLDEYPYYETTNVNSVDNASTLFFNAYNAVDAVAQGKPIWITETGWPTSGPTQNLAVANTENAETYWKSIACELISRNINVWWYLLNDVGQSPSFGVQASGETPLYDLSCPSVATSSSAAPTSSVASATVPTSAAASTTISISNAVPSAGYNSGAQTSSAALSSVVSSVASVAPSVSSQVSSAASSASSVAASLPVASSAVSSASSVAASLPASSSAVSSAASSSAETTVVPVTTQAATSVADDGETVTVFSTTLITVTNCGSSVACTSTGMLTSVGSKASESASSVLASAKPSVTSAAGSSVVPSGTPSASGCPADLNGAYQYPHLIVPVDANNPNKAYGTQYNGTISGKVSTIFNFDIPASYAGKTCSTVFLFPELDQLETSSYSFNNQGGFTIAVLNGVANEQTTYSNAPAVAKQIGSVDQLKPGSSHTLSMDSCPGGSRVSFEITSTGGLDLEFFQGKFLITINSSKPLTNESTDYNPSPLGLYVRAC